MSINQLKVGASLTYVNIILTNVIGLVLTPFIIHSLGDSEYGLYTLLGSFIAYLALMDMGLNNTIVRFVAKYRAEDNIVEEQTFLGSIFMIYFIISGVVLIVGVFFYFNLENIFSQSLTIDQIVKAKMMFVILVFNVVITLPGGAFTAICNAYEYFVFPRTLGIIRYIVRAITVVAVLTLGGDALSIVILDTVLNIMGILVVMSYSFRKLKIKINFSEFKKDKIKSIFSYSLWMFIIAITQSFQWNAGQVVLGINANTVQVAIFAVGIMLGTYYGAFAGAINTLLLPKASQMVVEGKSSLELTEMMIKIGRICNGISYLILSGFFLFGKEFIFLWLGSEYAQSWFVALMVMLGMTIPLSHSFGNSIIEARNKVRYKAVVNMVTIIIGVLIGFYLSKYFGLMGMITPLAGAMFMNAIITQLYFRKIFGFNILLFYSKVYCKQTFFILILIIGAMKFKEIIQIDSWIVLGVIISSYAIVYSVIFYLILMDKSERKMINNYA